MNNGIQVGDLVMVVRGHGCVLARLGGVPFRVSKIVPQSGGGWRCVVCGEGDIAQNEKVGAQFDGVHGSNDVGSGIPVNWLRRIPPLAELDVTSVEEGETLHA